MLRRKRRLRAGTVQLLAAAAAVALAFLTPQIHVGFDIPTTRAIEMLIAVGVGTVTFIGIVFSLLFLVVQFASTTFTPRLNLFRDDPIVWRVRVLHGGGCLLIDSRARDRTGRKDLRDRADRPVPGDPRNDHRVSAAADGRVQVDPAGLGPGPGRAPRPPSDRWPVRTESARQRSDRLPEETAERVASFATWLNANGLRVMGWLVGAVGIGLIVQGLAAATS